MSRGSPLPSNVAPDPQALRLELSWLASNSTLDTVEANLRGSQDWQIAQEEYALLSIYLDTDDRDLARSEDEDRTHIRLRWYGHGDKRTGPWFEVKRVGDPHTQKQRLHLAHQRTPRGVDAWHGILDEVSELLPQGLAELSPSVAVQSRRRAFQGPGQRVTLDRGIEYAVWFPDGPEDSMDESLWVPLTQSGLIEWKGPDSMTPTIPSGVEPCWQSYSKFERACQVLGWRE